MTELSLDISQDAVNKPHFEQTAVWTPQVAVSDLVKSVTNTVDDQIQIAHIISGLQSRFAPLLPEIGALLSFNMSGISWPKVVDIADFVARMRRVRQVAHAITIDAPQTAANETHHKQAV